MADKAEEIPAAEAPAAAAEEGQTETAEFKAPAEMSTQEIMNKDAEDESLKRYKEMLMGQAAKEPAIHDANNPSRMIGKSMTLVVEGRDDVMVDLTDLEAIKQKVFTIKEGCEYKIRIEYWVQREIVVGLKYIQQTYRKSVRVDKSSFMMGNYSPVPDAHTFTTQQLDAPKGMLARGHYTVKSKFRDDDGNEYAEWNWNFDIKKDWN